MSPTINKIDDRTYQVDDHQVVQDQEGNWIAQTEMTTRQVMAFQRHISAVNRKGVEPPSTYKV